MKKRDRLGLISSILGVFAICGLSCLGLFVKDKKTVSVGASLYLHTESGNYSYECSEYSSDMQDLHRYTIHFRYNFEYIYSIVNDIDYYQYHVSFSSYIDYRRDSTWAGYSSDTWYFNYASGESGYISNPSLNNLPVFDIYSPVYTESSNEFKLIFAGYEAPLGNTSTNGNMYFNLRPFASTYDIGVNSILYNSNGDIVDSFPYQHLYNQLPHNGSTALYIIDTTYVFGTTSFDDGLQVGYQNGYGDGYNQGQLDGYNEGYNQGYNQGKIDGYNEGYSIGYGDGNQTSGVSSTIISGIFQVALIPINFFLAIFNFEILGVNLTSVIQAIMTITITIIIVKMVMGSRGS